MQPTTQPQCLPMNAHRDTTRCGPLNFLIQLQAEVECRLYISQYVGLGQANSTIRSQTALLSRLPGATSQVERISRLLREIFRHQNIVKKWTVFANCNARETIVLIIFASIEQFSVTRQIHRLFHGFLLSPGHFPVYLWIHWPVQNSWKSGKRVLQRWFIG